MDTLNRPHLAPTLDEAKKMYKLREEAIAMLDDYYAGVDLPMDFDPLKLEDLVKRIDERFQDFDKLASPYTLDAFGIWVMNRPQS